MALMVRLCLSLCDLFVILFSFVYRYNRSELIEIRSLAQGTYWTNLDFRHRGLDSNYDCIIN